MPLDISQIISTKKPLREYLWRYKVFLLIIFLYILYFSNNAYVTSGDAVPATLIPWAVLEDHTVVLDNFNGFIITQWSDHYFIVPIRGHLVSTTPIVTPILAVPFYAPVYLLGQLSGSTVIDFSDSFIFMTGYCMKFAAATIAILSVIVLYFLLKRLFNEQWAFILSICYGVCTSTWTISSQSLWQHGTAELLIVCSYYLVINNISHRSNINIFGIGALSALIFFNRPSDAIFLIPILFYVLKEKYWQALPAFVIAGLPFFIYNIYFFDSIFGSYKSGLNPGIYTITAGVSTPSSFSLSGYLGSIFGGYINFILLLLMYTPISIMAVIGIWNALKNENKNKGFIIAIIISLVVFIAFFGTYNLYQGWGYGPRFWTDALPAIFLLIGWSKTDHMLYNLGFIILALISFIIQAYGAYVYLPVP